MIGLYLPEQLADVSYLDERFFKEHGTPLFSSHMIDLSEEPVDFNIETTAK